jgi:hypothetical protein
MTQFCRTGPPATSSERSYVMVDHNRPSSSGSQSECSNPTSFSSFEPPSGSVSPTKQMLPPGPGPIMPADDKKKKGNFFQAHSPFRRKSKHEKQFSQGAAGSPANRNSWAPSKSASENTSPARKGPFARSNTFGDQPGGEEPVDPRANFQLNVGANVFDVASPDGRRQQQQPKDTQDDMDPIAQALAELKGVTKQASVRISADRYHGLSTPAPPATPGIPATPVGGVATPLSNHALGGAMRGTPPPSYDQPMSRLGAPQPAFTSRQMQQTTQKYIDQKQNMFNPASRPPTRGSSAQEMPPRGASPAPPRAASPRPGMYNQQPQQNFRAPSPNPYASGANRPRAQSSSPIKGSYGSYSRGNSPGSAAIPRAVSPAPPFAQPQRPGSSRGSDMALQLAQPGGDSGSVYGGSQRGRGGSAEGRPTSAYYGNGSGRGGSDVGPGGYTGGGQVSTRVRSKSVAEPRQFTKDGRPILHYGKLTPARGSVTKAEYSPQKNFEY